ncbi:MAG: hypothetical protein KDJ97_29460 [Anaerolineae bacterium]|nr:hypothetical protein [Anaerolineae bacterium]MCB9105712.1 hypothetical protein [Anaerolineales bacterium]
MTSEYMQRYKKYERRPTGVSIIAALYFFLGILSLLWSLLVFGAGSFSSLFGTILGAEQMAAFGNTTAWSGFLGFFSAAVQIAIAFGLLGMKKWAWFLALIGVGLTVLEGIVGIFTGGLYAFMCGSLTIAIPIAMLVYLLLPVTRRAFRMQTR